MVKEEPLIKTLDLSVPDDYEMGTNGLPRELIFAFCVARWLLWEVPKLSK